jgi:hypothetical protein
VPLVNIIVRLRKIIVSGKAKNCKGPFASVSIRSDMPSTLTVARFRIDMMLDARPVLIAKNRILLINFRALRMRLVNKSHR